MTMANAKRSGGQIHSVPPMRLADVVGGAEGAERPVERVEDPADEDHGRREEQPSAAARLPIRRCGCHRRSPCQPGGAELTREAPAADASRVSFTSFLSRASWPRGW